MVSLEWEIKVLKWSFLKSHSADVDLENVGERDNLSL